MRVVTDSAWDHLEAWAAADPDAPALSQDDLVLSYAQLRNRVEADAGRLSALGVQRGDRVLLAGLNTIDWVCAFLAGMRAGAIVVPLNSRLGSAQLGPLVETVSPVLALVDDTQQHLFDHLGVAGPPLWHIASTEQRAGAVFGEVRPASLTGVEAPSADEPALLSFTSGTTGEPKGAVISHRALVSCAEAYRAVVGLPARSRTTALGPLFHNTGYVDQLVHMLVVGGQLDLVDRFSRRGAVEAMIRRPPDYLALVPSILRILMLHERADEVLASCRAVLTGGSPLPPAWIEELHRRWSSMRVHFAYGLTEFTSVSHMMPPAQLIEQPDAVGYPLDGVQCSIRDRDGSELPPGRSGEVWLSGPRRMIEYWGRPEESARVLQGEWLRTGDVGTTDREGLLRLHGRLNEVINRGGEKILPSRVEDLISASDDVAEVAVVGLPDPVLGQRVAAAVVLRPGRALNPDQLVAQLHDHLPDYAIPETVLAVDELPRGPVGKVDRTEIEALLSKRLESCSESL